jgi:hypothetical protein
VSQSRDDLPLVQVLEDAPRGALFIGEFLAEAAKQGVGHDALLARLERLKEAGTVDVFSFPAPDPHLESFDLRVVALCAGSSRPGMSAAEAAHAYWDSWVRGFLGAHRCT